MNEPSELKKVLRAFDNKDFSTIYSSVLEQKINPNSLIASKGVSLLHLIIGHHSENFAFKVTKFFLRCGGGDPNVQSSDGVTPTHVAAGWGRNRILHLLLVNGGDPWVLDDEKRNAFNYAFEEQEWNTIEMLHYFQQMHSAINAKQMMERPKISFDLENMLLHKKEEILAYASNKISKKSKMTQTYNYFYDSPSSPVQDKIKYFEPNQNTLLELNYWKKPEKFNAGWSKNAYQTSCEVVVPCDPDKELKNEKNKKQTFISSIHINTSPKTLNSNPPKCVSNSPPLDIRSQLFVELQEAVSRRSRQKVLRQGSKTNLSTSFVEYCKSNSMIISNVNLGEKEKENCQVDSTDLEDRDTDLNDMLKNMSDKIMPVMDESKISKEETEKKIDLCTSESDWTNNCSSSEGESSVQKPELQNIQTFIIPQNNSVENTSLYLTPYNSNLSSDFINNKTKENNSNASFVSFSEEYKSGDVTKDVILSDKNVLVTPTTSLVLNTHAEETNESDVSENSSTASSALSNISYNSEILRRELLILGYHPGPITNSTKKIYLKKLWRIKNETTGTEPVKISNQSRVYSLTLEKTFVSEKHFQDIQTYRVLEEEMCRSFEKLTRRKWREGNNKTSFNYLLLDPRISSNLPKRAREMEDLDSWKCFLSSIFYIGKGKRSRPYAHLHKAVSFWEKKTHFADKKITRITEIWKQGMGVVCLQVFQNIIPVEAFTREASMIDAIGLSSLKNAKIGNYYGIASTWPRKYKLYLGTYLLHKAFLIFLNEGERQIKPYDID